MDKWKISGREVITESTAAIDKLYSMRKIRLRSVRDELHPMTPIAGVPWTFIRSILLFGCLCSQGRLSAAVLSFVASKRMAGHWAAAVTPRNGDVG